MKNYDMNLTYSGRFAVQKVRLKFQQWGYSRTETVEVGGNCLGATIFDSAIGIIYDQLIEGLDKRDTPCITLAKGKKTLDCEDDDNRGEKWLSDMCVSAEILSISPQSDASAE